MSLVTKKGPLLLLVENLSLERWATDSCRFWTQITFNTFDLACHGHVLSGARFKLDCEPGELDWAVVAVQFFDNIHCLKYHKAGILACCLSTFLICCVFLALGLCSKLRERWVSGTSCGMITRVLWGVLYTLVPVQRVPDIAVWCCWWVVWIMMAIVMVAIGSHLLSQRYLRKPFLRMQSQLWSQDPQRVGCAQRMSVLCTRQTSAFFQHDDLDATWCHTENTHYTWDHLSIFCDLIWSIWPTHTYPYCVCDLVLKWGHPGPSFLSSPSSSAMKHGQVSPWLTTATSTLEDVGGTWKWNSVSSVRRSMTYPGEELITAKERKPQRATRAKKSRRFPSQQYSANVQQTQHMPIGEMRAKATKRTCSMMQY